MKILAAHLHTFIAYAQLRGIALEDIKSVLPTSHMNEGERIESICVEDFYAALSYIKVKLCDDLFGLRVGECQNLNALGLVYEISLQAATIEEGLLYLKSFLDATLPLIKIDTLLEPEKVMIALSIEHDLPSLNRILLESTLMVIERELTMMAGESFSAQVFSPFYQKGYPSSWAKGEHYMLSFKPIILKAAIKKKNHLHLELLIPQYLKLIEHIKAAQHNKATFSMSSRVKIASLQMAKPELPSLENVADVFNLTPRTLQRHIKGENQTFRQITDELKKQIAYLLIHHPGFTITDLSYVLGYGEPAAFIHCFKKWYGQTPNKFRQKLNIYAS
jgi:AraC-like DNA-binding protein